MSQAGRSPGPIAERTFERGFKIAILGGLAGVGLLYWTGILSATNGVHISVTLVLFPVYLVFAGALLGVWLGFATDERDLQRVTEEVDLQSDDSR
jgi:hypothetical protein